jgi:hypothetical protein
MTKILPRNFKDLDGNLAASLAPCRKRPVIVHAAQMNTNFRVDSMEGNYKLGKPGDYLMRGIKGELYICDKAIFEETYDFIEDFA